MEQLNAQAQNLSVNGAGSEALAAVPQVSAPGPSEMQSVALYVGDLHPDLTEANLFEVFSTVGPVASVRVCRDMVTRRSLGYGYVNFSSSVDAERALDTMNFYSSPATKGRPLRLMWKNRDPSLRKYGQGNIFVKNMDKSIDNKTLYDTFSKFGNILSCKVQMDDDGTSRGYGFVHFETPEAAEAAIEEVNGKEIAGSVLTVAHFKSRKERTTGETVAPFTNVFVKNLPASVDSEEKLKELFGEFGEITSVYIPKDGSDAKVTEQEGASEENGSESSTKGFAFVNFAEAESAMKAVEAMNGKEMDGKVLYAGKAQKKADRESELRAKYEQLKMERIQKYQSVNLFVKNLSDDVDDEWLRQEFGQFGTIVSSKLMIDEKGNSRGFGFVCFSQPEEATKAVTELNGRIIGQKPIWVSLAQSKEVRRAQLEAQRSMGLGVPGVIPGAPMFAPGAPMMYPPNIPPQFQAAAAGRPGQPAFVNPQYLAAMGRGGPVPQMIMRPGFPLQPGMPGLPGQFGIPMQQQQQPQQRNPRQGRQRQPPMPGQSMGADMYGPRMGANGNNVRSGSSGGRPGAMQQQFKYTATARNAGQPGGPPMSNEEQYDEMPGMMHEESQTDLTIEMLTNASPQEQKAMLGERLYPLIYERNAESAGKITGMLLEMDNSEILNLLESPDALEEKIEEAVEVLNEHAAQLAAAE